jgi:hypothetical protein
LLGREFTIPMNLVLRPFSWSDGYSRPDDYEIIHEERIGRIYRINSLAKGRWCWTQLGPRMCTHIPNGGIADSLDEANAALQAALERCTREPEQNTIEKRTISVRWTDKVGIVMLAIAAIIAAVLALKVFVYPTWTETVGAAIGLFVAMVAFLAFPLWLILRIAVWVARETHGAGRQGRSLHPSASKATNPCTLTTLTTPGFLGNAPPLAPTGQIGPGRPVESAARHVPVRKEAAVHE